MGRVHEGRGPRGGWIRRSSRGGPYAAVLAAALGIPATAAALPAGCTQSGATVTCAYTSGTNSFTVPAGISTVHVVAVGGAGASNGKGVSGGHGARAEADLTVTPGETLYAVVGGNGGTLGSFTSDPGANGGGQGGSGDCIGDVCTGDGGGGGASDVRTSATDLTTRLIVAGGGGGAGATWNASGGGGGNAGESGSPGTAYSSTTAAGTPGGGASPVAGGVGASGPSAPSGGGYAGCNGDAGSLGTGGTGGGGSNAPCGLGGGGGGGGLYGGGGGAAGATNSSNDISGAGGGGGGSSLVPAGGSVTLDYSANPVVVISYVVAGSPTAQLTPQAALTGVSPYTLAFTASFAPSPGATVSSVLIGWGDGTTASSFSSPSGSSLSVSHTFAHPGTYLVTMKVTDSEGESDRDELVVTVTAPAAPAVVPKCVVPKLGRSPVALAKQVLTLLGCKVGKTSTARSKSVGKGLVIGTAPGRGTYAAGQVIALTVSSGPPPKKKKHKK